MLSGHKRGKNTWHIQKQKNQAKCEIGKFSPKAFYRYAYIKLNVIWYEDMIWVLNKQKGGQISEDRNKAEELNNFFVVYTVVDTTQMLTFEDKTAQNALNELNFTQSDIQEILQI